MLFTSSAFLAGILWAVGIITQSVWVLLVAVPFTVLAVVMLILEIEDQIQNQKRILERYRSIEKRKVL